MFATIAYQDCGQTLMGHLLILNKEDRVRRMASHEFQAIWL
jgi:hypothetical protein